MADLFFSSEPLVNEEQLRQRLAELTSALDLPVKELSPQEVDDLLEGLPRLTEEQVDKLGHKESVCPICFNALLSILSEEETAIAMDSPAHPIEELGVTRLAADWQCGHIFCRRDISKWIRDGHDSCPACRGKLIKTSENTTEARSPDSPTPAGDEGGDEPLSIDEDPLAMFEGFTMTPGIQNLARAFFTSVSASSPRDSADDDRHEFAGMYS